MCEPRDPVTIAAAAERLEVPQPTLRVWASRHNARRLAKAGKTVYYDFNDLCTIEAHLHMGKRVPKTPELRDEYRERLRATAA